MRRPVAESINNRTTTEPTTMDHGEQKLNRSFPENVAFSSFCIRSPFPKFAHMCCKIVYFRARDRAFGCYL